VKEESNLKSLKIESEGVVEEDSPLMEVEEQNMSHQLLIPNKNSKSQHRIKTELSSEPLTSQPTCIKKIGTQKIKQKSRSKDECLKFVEKKIHKIVKF
jgi:hypothetical protein